MQNTLVRYRRQDRTLRIGVATFILLIGAVFAAPLVAGQAGQPDIPLFKPYRGDVLAQR